MTADMDQQPKLFKVPCAHCVCGTTPQTRNLLHGGLSCSATALPSRLLPESATPRPCRTIKCMSVLCDWSLISCWRDLSKPSCTYMMCSHSNIRGDPYGDLRGVIGRSCTVELCECISCAIARSAQGCHAASLNPGRDAASGGQLRRHIAYVSPSHSPYFNTLQAFGGDGTPSTTLHDTKPTKDWSTETLICASFNHPSSSIQHLPSLPVSK